MRSGFRVVLVGPPNVGKSSLFNRLVGTQSAIVTPIPGTTRDLLRAELDIGGVPVTVIDSAGLRSTSDPIEMEGVRRTREAAEGADVILRVSSPDVEESAPPPIDSRTLRIWNKSDLELPAPFDSIAVSSSTGAGFDQLLSRLIEKLSSERGWGEPPVATRLRHRDMLGRVLAELKLALVRDQPVELVAERLRACLAALEELMGKTTSEDILDLIFREFCIGK
jgi:tRNA modification GTPase